MSHVEISIVIAVYDNASTLDELIGRLVGVLEATGRTFEVIFVDDGSRDESFRLLGEHAARDPRIRVYALTRNFGKQAAICAALDRVQGRYVLSVDADLETPPEDLPTLIRLLDEGYDLVCGYRELRDAPWLTRRLPSALMNAYIRRETGTRIRDLGCGARGMLASLVADLETEGEHRRLLTPLLLKRARRVVEIPVSPGIVRRTSKHSFLALLSLAADYYLLTARRPFLISGLCSLAAVVVGVLVLAFGTFVPGLIVLTGGLLGAVLSLVGEYCQRLYALHQRRPFYELRPPERTERTVGTRRDADAKRASEEAPTE